jgi:outer membrane protein TolC
MVRGPIMSLLVHVGSAVQPHRLAVLPAAGALCLAACATYAPRPLSAAPDLAEEVPHLRVAASRLPLPGLRGHPFNPDDGLDMVEVAILAVVNNPELKAARREAGVARAQVFAARLLPDPQLSLSLDDTTDTGPGLTNAYNAGISYDLMALVTRGTRIEASSAERAKVDLDVLWKEWQVVQQAETLFVQACHQREKLVLLRSFQSLYADRYARSRKALRQGNLTLEVTGTDLTALMDATTRVDDMDRQLADTDHKLNALLGLAPELTLSLVPGAEPPPPGRGEVTAALANLPRRRPDLLALQAGYRSQEARVRQAVLEQFPVLNLGVTAARDTTNVHTIGVGATLTLPLLDRNRGHIAVERATRARLHDEYQARLDQADGEVHQLWAQHELLARQLREVTAELPTLKAMASQAQRAYEAQDISALVYLNLENTSLNMQIEALDLRQSLLGTRIALQTLLGQVLPGQSPAQTGTLPPRAPGEGEDAAIFTPPRHRQVVPLTPNASLQGRGT